MSHTGTTPPDDSNNGTEHTASRAYEREGGSLVLICGSVSGYELIARLVWQVLVGLAAVPFAMPAPPRAPSDSQKPFCHRLDLVQPPHLNEFSSFRSRSP